MKKRGRKKVGIALSSGSVRGLSHIGVLKILEKEKIPIDYIAATSIGAVVGACYASGMDVNKLEETLKTTKLKKLMDFTVPKTGFLAGKKIEKFLGSILDYKNFDELSIPLSIIVTEINKGEKIILNRGSVARAARASLSIPGVFSPVIVDDNVLIDGNLVDPIPIDVVKEMGADIIIAVDLSIDLLEGNLSNLEQGSKFVKVFERKFISTELKYLKGFIRKKKLKVPYFIWRMFDTKKIVDYLTGRKIPKIVDYTIKSLDILENQLAKEKLKSPFVDVVIKPSFQGVRMVEFDKAQHCIAAGEIATGEMVPKIKRLLNGSR